MSFKGYWGWDTDPWDWSDKGEANKWNIIHLSCVVIKRLIKNLNRDALTYIIDQKNLKILLVYVGRNSGHMFANEFLGVRLGRVDFIVRTSTTYTYEYNDQKVI